MSSNSTFFLLSPHSLIEWGREQENLELGKSLDGKACGEWKYWNCANFKNCPWTQRSSSGRPTVLSKCGKCLWTRYCSRDCQKKHWQQHKAHCTNPGFMRIAEQSTKVLRKEFDERRDLLIDLEKRLQTEKSYLQTAVERKDIEPTFSKADERSTIVEKELEKVYKKECKEWMRSLEDQILKQKAGMKEAMETIAGCAAGVARIPIMEEATPVLTIFLTIFSEVNIGREQTVGGLLFKKHNTKGAISMEFDSVAVVKKAIAWLDHKKEDFVERRDNKRVDKAALHSSSNVLPRLFLDQQINGMVVSYMTSLEAYLKAETIRSALSFLSTPAIGQFVAKDVELFEKLCYAIEDYDRRHAVLLHVYLKIHLSKIEEGKHFFIHRWVVAN